MMNELTKDYDKAIEAAKRQIVRVREEGALYQDDGALAYWCAELTELERFRATL